MTGPPWHASSFWNLLWNLSTYWTGSHLCFCQRLEQISCHVKSQLILIQGWKRQKVSNKAILFPSSQFNRLYKGYWSKMLVLNLFKQGVVAPLWENSGPEETIMGDSFVSICVDTWGKASHLPFISLCMWHPFQSTAHLPFIGTQLSLS